MALRRIGPITLAVLALAQGGLAATSLPMVRDDYTMALAEARARQLPLFIEAWAPW